MSKKQSILLCGLFLLFLAVFSLLNLFWPDREFSEMENRTLASNPPFSFQALFSGQWTTDYETYLTDQFPLRDTWVGIKYVCERAMLRQENNGIYFADGGRLIARFDQPDEARVEQNFQAVEALAQNTGLPTRFVLVPTTAYIYQEDLPKNAPSYDQQQLFDRASQLHTAQYIPVNDLLMEHKEDYIYYRTDHHWTTYGAYLAVCAYAGERGMTPPPLEAIDSQKVPNFYGTYFSKAKKAGAKADVITYYEVPVRSVTVADEERDGLYDLQKFETRDKYAAFLWGNNNRTVIESDQNLNKVEGKKTRVLLIKDSYGNCFAPFLCYLYDEVVIADLRYLPKASDLMEDGQYDDVLLMYNFESLASDGYLAKLRY